MMLNKNKLKEHGFDNIEPNMDDGLLKQILAYGDEDVLSAINDEDIVKYLNIMNDKGYIKELQNSVYKLSLKKQDVKKLEKLRTSLLSKQVGKNVSLSPIISKENEIIVDEKDCFAAVVAVFVAAVVAVSHVAALYTVAAEVNVETHATVHHKVALYTKTQVKTNGYYDRHNAPNDILSDFIEANPSIKIWGVKTNNPEITYQIADTYINDKIEEIMKIIEEIYPNIYNLYSYDKLKYFLCENLF